MIEQRGRVTGSLSRVVLLVGRLEFGNVVSFFAFVASFLVLPCQLATSNRLGFYSRFPTDLRIAQLHMGL